MAAAHVGASPSRTYVRPFDDVGEVGGLKGWRCKGERASALGHDAVGSELAAVVIVGGDAGLRDASTRAGPQSPTEAASRDASEGDPTDSRRAFPLAGHHSVA